MINRSGFTIVELLIVIVVISILAAISIVAYNGIQDRSYRAAIQSNLSNFQKRIEQIKIESTDGLYPLTPPSNLGVGFLKSAYTVGRNNLYYCTSPDRTQYALGTVLINSSGGSGYRLSSANGSITFVSGVDDATTCAVVGKANGSATGYA